MTDILAPIQVSLGFSRDDLTDRNGVRISIGGSPATYTFTLPTAGTYFWNDRQAVATSMPAVFLALLNAAETALATGQTWTLTLDAPTIGYNTYTRTASAAIAIPWSHAGSTVLPRWFGFDGTDISFTGTTLVTDWQAGRLWLPGDRFPARWESRQVREGRTRFNPFTGSVTRFGQGGYTMHRLVIEHLRALFVYGDRSSKASYLTAREGVVSGDQNVSWEKGTWQDLYDTEAPLRICRDRSDPTTYTEAQVWRPEELDDLSKVFEETHPAPQRYRCEMMLVEESS